MVYYKAPVKGKSKQRYSNIAANEAYLHKVVSMGAEKARESASKTLKEVRKAVGFRKF